MYNLNGLCGFKAFHLLNNQVGRDGAAVHLGLHGTRVFPSMPQLNVPDHDVTARVLLKEKYQSW